MTPRRIFLILFLSNALVHVFGQGMGVQILIDVTKPLILPFLAGYYVASSSFPRSMQLLAALFACWVGDIALMFAGYGEVWFMDGLVAFLVGHVLYVITYRRFRWESTETGLSPVQKIRFSLPVVLAGTGLIVVLYPVLGALKVPVAIYATIMMIMMMNAIFRFGRTPSKSFWLVLLGALLFMASDSILAINKFMAKIEMSGVLIMTTYISAQYFIVEGLLKHKDR